jgi:alkylated DNA repair dioxygenase AlkB
MTMPAGFTYRPSLITEVEERALLAELAALDFKPFEFRGYFGKRRIVSFGWRYDFNDSKLKRAAEMPPYLAFIRERAAEFAGLPREAIEHALITEYEAGAPIGWHKDRSIFGDVIGISLNSPCIFRMRRKRGQKWERASIELEPRSAYLLRGEARTDWEHSIPEVESLRYSITFRTMKSHL